MDPCLLVFFLCFFLFSWKLKLKAVSPGWSSDKGSAPGWLIVMHCHENNETNFPSRWPITPNNLCGGGKNAVISQALLFRIVFCSVQVRKKRLNVFSGPFTAECVTWFFPLIISAHLWIWNKDDEFLINKTAFFTTSVFLAAMCTDAF